MSIIPGPGQATVSRGVFTLADLGVGAASIPVQRRVRERASLRYALGRIVRLVALGGCVSLRIKVEMVNND